jgi:hypothetical protein
VEDSTVPSNRVNSNQQPPTVLSFLLRQRSIQPLTGSSLATVAAVAVDVVDVAAVAADVAAVAADVAAVAADVAAVDVVVGVADFDSDTVGDSALYSSAHTAAESFSVES